MSKITLPLLAALTHLHAHNLTIARLWTESPPNGPPVTHIETKPADSISKDAPRPNASNVYQYQQSLPHCVVCHRPKDKPGHATCLDVTCLRVFLFGK